MLPLSTSDAIAMDGLVRVYRWVCVWHDQRRHTAGDIVVTSRKTASKVSNTNHSHAGFAAKRRHSCFHDGSPRFAQMSLHTSSMTRNAAYEKTVDHGIRMFHGFGNESAHVTPYGVERHSLRIEDNAHPKTTIFFANQFFLRSLSFLHSFDSSSARKTATMNRELAALLKDAVASHMHTRRRLHSKRAARHRKRQSKPCQRSSPSIGPKIRTGMLYQAIVPEWKRTPLLHTRSIKIPQRKGEIRLVL